MKPLFSTCAFAALMSFLALPAFAEQPVTINFAAEIAGKPFSCDATYAGLGATAAEVSVTDYRVFVSSPALIRADGSLQPITLDQDGTWQHEDVALLDFEDGTAACSGTGNPGLNTALRGTVPEGNYVGAAFTVGLPFDKNHIDPTLAAAPLNTTGMFWNWQYGFRFVRIDMVPTETGAEDATGWFLHLGSTECAAETGTEAPAACGNPNLMSIVLPDFDPARHVVVIDPAPVVSEADLRVNAPETSPGCMAFPGDADCNTVMSKLGLAFDGIPPGNQLLITAR